MMASHASSSISMLVRDIHLLYTMRCDTANLGLRLENDVARFCYKSLPYLESFATWAGWCDILSSPQM